MWHTNPNCKRWPLMDYVEDSPTGPMAHLMICPHCRLLDDELSSNANEGRISKLSRTEKP